MKNLAICLFLLVANSLLSAEKPWNSKMKELSEVLTELIPDVSQTEENPSQKKRLDKNLKRLAKLAKEIGAGHDKMTPPDSDPSLALFSSLFQQQTKQAYASLKGGRVDYAKGLTRNLASYCIACHSRNQTGPNFSDAYFDKKIEKLSDFEKAQFYASTRRFDSALPLYKKIVSNGGTAKTRQLEWQKAVHQALAIAVRYKKDVEESLDITNKVIASETPEFLKKYATSWKNSLSQWKEEPKKTLDSEEKLWQEADRLFKKGLETQKYSLDHSGDIYFLRATSHAHDLLGKYPKGSHAADALLLTGRSYEILNDPVLWPLHELYYQICVTKYPHSPQAQACYHHLEESVYFGYSGSGGFSIPAGAAELLKDLKEKSSIPHSRKDQ